MKKILIFILALALICTNAFAATISQNGASVTVTDVPEGGKLIIAGYDEAGRLSASRIYAPENGTINAENFISGAAKTKMFLWDMDTLAPIEMTEQQPSAGSKMLVAYFSWTNNTEGIANHIADITGADKFEITPVEPYGEENNNYYDQSTRAYKEQYDDSARPEIDGAVANMEQYDVVFLGFPIWYGKAPKLIYTFLESYDFEGKTVVPFCTSGSSGISTRELVPLAPGANWLDGRRFSGGASRNTVESWVNSLDIEIEEEPEVPENMALIRGGSFSMGSPSDEPERDADEATHTVTVGDFYLSKTELTQKDYQSVMGENPSENMGDELPVENITWYDAVEYCNRLSVAEGLTPCYSVDGTTVTWNKAADGYRLPTEAEWEYAARANTTTPFSFGDYVHDEDANCYNAYGYNNNASGSWVNGYLSHTVDVNSYNANANGLYNIHGNVGEWVWDWYGEYGGASANPTGPESGHNKIARGGGWNDFPKHIRSAYRSAYPAGQPLYSIGLRVARGAVGTGSVRSVDLAKAPSAAGKTLIVYFSQTGNTDGLANIIQDMTGADMFRIERATPYSSTHNSQGLYAEALTEQRENAVPDLKAYLEDEGLNIDDYDTILLGYCNWWASIPAPVRSFLLRYDMSGKTIVPFCSMGGGRFGQTISAVAKLAPEATILEGLDVTYSSYNRNEISAWLEQSGVEQK